MRRTVAALVTGSLLALGATGCTEDEPQPKVPDTSTPSTPAPSTSSESQSPSGSDTPSDPGTPRAWEEHSEDGADAFVRHWIDLFNDARLEDGSTQALLRASTEGCATCSNFADHIERWREQGVMYQSEPWTVFQIGTISYSPREVSFIVGVRQPKEVIQSPGHSQEQNAAAEKNLRFTLRWSHRWLTHEIAPMS